MNAAKVLRTKVDTWPPSDRCQLLWQLLWSKGCAVLAVPQGWDDAGHRVNAQQRFAGR